MEALDIERRHQTRIIGWTVAAASLLALPPTALHAWNGDPDAFQLWALLSASAALGLWAAHRARRLDLFRSMWIGLTVCATGAGLWWTGNASPASFLLLMLMPLITVLVHSARAGGYTALACWVALLIPLVIPREVSQVPPSLVLLLGAVGTTLWGFGAYLDSSRARALDQTTELAKRLERNENRFRSYTEHGRDLITEFDTEGRVLYMSPGHEKLLGRSPTSFLEGDGHLSVHPEDQKNLIQYFQEVRDGDRSGYCTVRYRRPDREVRWLHLRGSTYKTEDGETRIVIRAHDETEQRLAEQDRETLLVELQSALDNVKELRGIIPICATCKKIRRSDGEWEALEVYLSDHSEADLSHGICEDCLADVEI